MTATTGVFAIYPQATAVEEVLQTLAQGGFDKESICMMLAPSHPLAEMARDANLRPFERDLHANAGVIGWLSEFGAVLIPTFGFFIRSREFFHALLDQDSIAHCGRCGTLTSLGFSERDARRCEQRLRESGVMIYLLCANAAQSQWALELMTSLGADEAALLVREQENPVAPPIEAVQSAALMAHSGSAA